MRFHFRPLFFKEIFNGTIVPSELVEEGTMISESSQDRSIVIPERNRSATSVAAMSLSSPIFINAFLGLLSRISSVTSSQPKLENILAYSMATIPLKIQV